MPSFALSKNAVLSYRVKNGQVILPFYCQTQTVLSSRCVVILSTVEIDFAMYLGIVQPG